MIPVYKPFLTKNNLKFAHEALDSGWISSNDNGEYKELCQEFLRQYLGVHHVLLTSNGTTALHLIAKALGHFHPEIRNIYVPSNVYVAAWNMFEGYNLIPVDADKSTWNADYSNCVYKEDTAFLIVHNLGNPVNVVDLQRRFPMAVFIEDACEAFGGMYEGYKAGSQSFASVFSFYGNKTVTSGEGGALVTNSEEVYEYCRLLHAQGQGDTKFIHTTIGYNYRMTNIQASILYGQLQDLAQIFLKKKKIWDFYNRAFQDVEGIKIQKIDNECTTACWLYGIYLDNMKSYDSANVYFLLKDIETRPLFYPINYHDHFSYFGDNYPVSRKLSQHCLILPSYPELTDSELQQIVDAVYQYAKV